MSQSAVQSSDDQLSRAAVGTIDERNDLTGGHDPHISNPSIQSVDNDDEIQSLLLRHEKKSSSTGAVLNQKLVIPGAESDDQSDKSDSDSDFEDANTKKIHIPSARENNGDKEQEMSSDDDDGDIPVVKVGGEEYAITDINEDIIEHMSSEEKDRYIQISQDFYSNMYE